MTIEAPDARFYFDELAVPALDEAAQLYSLRNYKLQQRNSLLSDINDIDVRIQNNLKHLTLFSHATPFICAERYSLEDESDAFVAAYLAFYHNDKEWLQELFNAYLADINCLKAIAQAIAWLPFDLTKEWIQKLLSSNDLLHKHLGIRTCSLLFKFPINIIATLLNHDNCKANDNLHIALLTIAGQSRDSRLLSLITQSSDHVDVSVQAKSYWARLLMGDVSCFNTAINLSLQSNEAFHLLSPLILRLSPCDVVKQYLSAVIASDTISIDSKIVAMGVSGYPVSIPWIIANAKDEHTLGLAGHYFEQITGRSIIERADAEKDEVEIADVENKTEPDALDEYYLDTDDSLLIPSIESLDEHWKAISHEFTPNVRYFLGQPIQQGSLLDIPKNKNNVYYFKQQSFEMALLNPTTPLTLFILPRIVV